MTRSRICKAYRPAPAKYLLILLGDDVGALGDLSVLFADRDAEQEYNDADDQDAQAGAGNQKDVWYQKLYGTGSNGSTPLREALSRVGRYYAGKTTGINDGMDASPIRSSLPVQRSLRHCTSAIYGSLCSRATAAALPKRSPVKWESTKCMRMSRPKTSTARSKS